MILVSKLRFWYIQGEFSSFRKNSRPAVPNRLASRLFKFNREVAQMRKRIFFLLALGLGLSLAAAAFAEKPDAVLGKWWNEEKDAHIEIFSCEGKFCGK